MELIFIFVILLAISDKSPQLIETLKPLAKFLESGNIHDFTQSEQFEHLQIGSVSGKEIANAIDSAEQIQTMISALQSQTGSATDLAAQLLSKSLTLDTGALRNLFAKNNASDSNDSSVQSDDSPFAPIAAVADRDIIYALTRYFS